MNARFFICGALLFPLSPSLQAEVIWRGAPAGASDSPTRVFGNATTECAAPGRLTAVFDSAARGYVWNYFKPADSTLYRCESRNIRVDGYAYKGFTEGKTVYLGWGSKLEEVDGGPHGDWVIFQWKSYGDGLLQNYPLLMTANRGNVNLIYVDEQGAWRTIWQAPVADNSWQDYVLGLHLSADSTVGWVEFYVNGQQQSIGGQMRLPARTLDVANEPKWGAYNRDQPGHEMVQRISNPRVTTTLAEAQERNSGYCPSSAPARH